MVIDATAKEIADLVLALQGQRSMISDCCETMVNSFRSAIRDTDEEAQEA